MHETDTNYTQEREGTIRFEEVTVKFTLLSGVLLEQEADCYGISINDRACLGMTSEGTQIDRLRTALAEERDWRLPGGVMHRLNGI